MKMGIIRVIVLYWCLVAIFPTAALAAEQEQPTAAGGLIDASHWDFARQGTMELNGDWQFYWHSLLAPEDFTTSGGAPQPGFANVPHVWGYGGPDNPAPSNLGYATYRLIVRLDRNDTGIKALYIPAVASAYKLWINGKEAAGNGVVGTDAQTMKPKNFAKVVYFDARPGDNELVVQVSNFVQRKGGLWTPITLGNSEDVTLHRELKIVSQLVVGIGLLTLGIYHLGLFVLRKYDKLNLLIGLFCTLLAMRTLLLGDTLIVRFWPGLNWEIAVKLEYLAPYVGVPLFAWFVQQLYPLETSHKVVRAIIAIGAVFSAIVVLFPAIVFTKTMLAFQMVTIAIFAYYVYVFLLAVIRKREGARLNGIAMTVMFAAILNDMFYYNHYILSADFSSYGVFAFLFAQTLIVALKYTNAYYMVEKMSTKLQQANANLEEKIRERTKELEVSNAQLREANHHLQEIEALRKVVFTNISHELGTPMTAVQGYIKALLDGVIQPQDRKYISMIYDKVLMVNRLTQDLFDLSKLEAGSAKFETSEIAAEELFEQFFREFQYDVEKKNIRFELCEIQGLPQNHLALLVIDPTRIQQVVGNIVYNATKFTPPGGLIRISGELAASADGDKGTLFIRISDTGIGIDREAIPHIFDRFFKGSGEGHASSEGTGLGLAIAKEIVTYHGGTISVESEKNIGSTFQFTLPVELLPLEVE